MSIMLIEPQLWFLLWWLVVRICKQHLLAGESVQPYPCQVCHLIQVIFANILVKSNFNDYLFSSWLARRLSSEPLHVGSQRGYGGSRTGSSVERGVETASGSSRSICEASRQQHGVNIYYIDWDEISMRQ